MQKFALLELDLIKVKGKKQAVRIFTMAGDPAVAASAWFKTLRPLHDGALAAYRAQRWDDAISAIDHCVEIVKVQTGLAGELTGFYAVAKERILDFRANPPGADWDGVYIADTK